MKLSIREDKKWFWYLILAVFFTVLLLYIKFPSEAVTNYIRVQAEKSFPDLNISFKKIGLTLSPGIKIKGLTISFKTDPGAPVYFSEKSSLRVSIPGWLKGDPKYYFESYVKGGRISGIVEEKKEVKKDRVDATIDIEGIKLDENIFIHPVINERVEGVLTGKIIFMGNLSDPITGTTELSLNMADGKVKFLKPFLGMDRVNFKRINFSGVFDNRRLNIKDLKMTGGPLNGSASGTVRISNNLLNSRLNLKAEIEPLPSLSQEMPDVGKAINLMKNRMKDGKLRFDITGTPDRPLPKIR